MDTYRVNLDDGRVVRVEAASENDARQLVMDNFDNLPEAAPAAPKERSPFRPAGISTRGILEGAVKGFGTLGSLPLDAAYNVYAGLSSGADMGMPFTQGVSRAADSAGDMFGLPEAENTQERLTQSLAEGVSGGLMGGPVAGGLVKAAGKAAGSNIARGVGQSLAAGPGTQALAGGVGGVTAQGADEMGAPPVASAVAGMIGGTAAAAGASSVRAAHQMAKPFYASGKQDIIGNLMKDAASDPVQAAKNLENVPQYVPGSLPTTAAAARDAGLNSLSKGVERMSPQAKAAFDERAWDNNAARNDFMDGVVPTEGEQAARQGTRSNFADQVVPNLFNNPSANARVDDAFKALDDLKKSRLGLKRSPRTAEGIARKELESIAQPGANGIEADPGELYAIRQNIADLLQGDRQMTTVQGRDGASTDLRAARRSMMPVLNSIDDALEAASPGYKKYMKKFSGMSENIERGDILRGMRESSLSKQATDPKHGRSKLLLSGLKRSVESIRASKDFDKLTKTQQHTFKRLIQDLDREESAVRSVASAGSDTVQNLTTNAFIQRMMGNRLGGALPRQIASPLQWLYKIPERQLQDLLLEAMIDPALGRKMLLKASPKVAEDVSNELARIYAAMQSSGRVSTGLAAGLADGEPQQ